MSDLNELERHKTFRAASERAKNLAVECQVQTGVKRVADEWAVMFPHDPPFEDEPPARSLRSALAGCEDSSGSIYLGDGVYL